MLFRIWELFSRKIDAGGNLIGAVVYFGIDGSVKALEWIDCLDVGKGPGGLYIDVAVGESLQDGSHCFVYCHLLVYPYSAGAEFLFIGKA